MDIKVEDFFKPINLKKSIKPEDYNITSAYIEAAAAFARATYQSIYIIDYNEKGFLYVSDNPLFLCGYTPDQVKEMGYSFYLKQVPKDDLKLLLEINIAGFQFYEKIPKQDRLLYTISYDFHLQHASKKTLLVNHKLTPLALDKSEKIWLALCVVSVSAHHTSGNIELRKKNDSTIYEYNREKEVWIKKKEIKLSDREKEILYLSAQGYNTHDIAQMIFLSDDTIKFHRKHIFEKLDVKNITEAIAYAVGYNII